MTPEELRALEAAAQASAYGQGNINLFSRPNSRNPDGSMSSLYSTGFGDARGQEVLAPGVDEHGGGILPDIEHGSADRQYQQTGHYLGKFSGDGAIDRSNMLGQFLHKEAESGLTTPPLASSRRDVNPEALRQAMLYLLTRGR